MIWLERIEKIARIVLWLTVASAVVLVPITYIRQRSSEAQLADAARREEQTLARKAKEAADKKPDRLTLASMGAAMRALDVSRSKGSVWFSNVSPRAGFVCVTGVVTNQTTKSATEALPACRAIDPYASNVEIPMMFAGSDVEETCRGASCVLSVKEAAESK